MPAFGIARKFASDLRNFIPALGKSGIDAYEMGFAYGIPADIPSEVLVLAGESKVKLSCHLPFWINLGNSDTAKNASYLLAGMRIAERLQSVAVFHLGYYLGRTFPQIREHVISILREVLSTTTLRRGRLGIETTGKQQALGTITEISELIRLIDDERIIPVIDWSHLFARSGGIHPYVREDFMGVLEDVEREIGYTPFYFHGGGIEHKRGNEVRHISARTHTPPLPHLFAALQDYGLKEFTLIVESPDSINDVGWLRQVWESPSEFAQDVPRSRRRTLLQFSDEDDAVA